MKIIGSTIAIEIDNPDAKYYLVNGNIMCGDKLILKAGLDQSIFNIVGTAKDLVFHPDAVRILPNRFIDYTDLNKRFVNLTTSFESWLKRNNIPKNTLLLTFSKQKESYSYLEKLPKTAIEPKFKDIFEKIDNSISDFKTNKFHVPINYNGYNYYNLDNFNIKDNLYYVIESNNEFIIYCTSVDINIQNILEKDKKKYLYDLIINKKIKLLTS